MTAAVKSVMDRIAFEITDGIIEFGKGDIDYYKNKYPDIYSVLISKWNNDTNVLLSIKQSDDSDGYYILGYGTNNNKQQHRYNYRKDCYEDYHEDDNKVKENLFLYSKRVSLSEVHSYEFSSIVESTIVDYYSRMLRVTSSMVSSYMHPNSALAEEDADDLKKTYRKIAKYITQMNAIPRLAKLDRLKLEFKTLADIVYQTLLVVDK